MTEKDELTFMLLERKSFVWNWSGSEEKQEHIVFERQIRQAHFSHVIFQTLCAGGRENGFLGDLLQTITCTHISELERQREYDFLLLLH